MRSEDILGLPLFFGAGVYTSLAVELPAQLPDGLEGSDAVVTGDSLAPALQLAPWCASVTLVTARTSRFHGPTPANVTVLYGTEIVCVDGLHRLESVVVRKIRSGALASCSAAALFILDTKGESS